MTSSAVVPARSPHEHERRTFGSLLRTYRCLANLTQEELAARSGLSTQAISALERGVRRSPRSSTIEFIAGALNLEPAARAALITAARPFLLNNELAPSGAK